MPGTQCPVFPVCLVYKLSDIMLYQINSTTHMRRVKSGYWMHTHNRIIQHVGCVVLLHGLFMYIHNFWSQSHVMSSWVSFVKQFFRVPGFFCARSTFSDAMVRFLVSGMRTAESGCWPVAAYRDIGGDETSDSDMEAPTRHRQTITIACYGDTQPSVTAMTSLSRHQPSNRGPWLTHH